jgi:hypothetical protein
LSHARPLHEHLIRYCRSWLVHNLLKFVRVYSDAMYRPVECVEIVLEVQWRPHPRNRLKKYLLSTEIVAGLRNTAPARSSRMQRTIFATRPGAAFTKLKERGRHPFAS